MNKDEYLWNMLQFRASEVEGYIEHFMENINNTNTKPEIYDEYAFLLCMSLFKN